jgi:anti-sigma factor RsiW
MMTRNQADGTGTRHTDTDALLVAYLDGELEPERRRELEQRLRSDASLRAHLTALADATELLRTSFDALLEEAPRARLYAAFAAALSRSPRRAKYQLRELLLAAAAALLLLIGGGVGGYFIAKAPLELFEEADAFEEAWIAAVVGQLSLYEGAAAASIPVNEVEQQTQLRKLGDVLNSIFLSRG